ncbi:MAG TPA: DUF6498-containing protein [Arenimonas sp.]|uniref:DUF6498-containing protein n=1 Tax=Arenimonas sp. TaxID=1872635 RepID=UPI002BFF8ADD|nr:DUF6498-containing protein [Arenimonas sp.]HMB56176.1 DUF6498-containing protein [Arenimonas sp.]
MREESSGSGDATWSLVGSNALTLVLGLALHWPVATLLWPYWLQSVIIGWYARKRMLALQAFSTEGFTSGSNEEPVPENETGKRETAKFFVIHYGFFHLFYLLFLLAEARPAGFLDVVLIAAAGYSFTYAQRKTFTEQVAADARGRPNLGALMFLPYLRVVPIHLSIVFGATMMGSGGLLLFVPLKTVADVLLDRIDRNFANQAADA